MTCFEHETHGRRPITIAAFAVISITGFKLLDPTVWSDPAGPWVIAIWTLCLVLLGWMIVRNPKTGLRIHENGIDWWDGRRHGTVIKSALSSFEIADWSDSTDYSIVLKDGEKIALTGLVDVNEEDLAKALAANELALTKR